MSAIFPDQIKTKNFSVRYVRTNRRTVTGNKYRSILPWGLPKNKKIKCCHPNWHCWIRTVDKFQHALHDFKYTSHSIKNLWIRFKWVCFKCVHSVIQWTLWHTLHALDTANRGILKHLLCYVSKPGIHNIAHSNLSKLLQFRFDHLPNKLYAWPCYKRPRLMGELWTTNQLFHTRLLTTGQLVSRKHASSYISCKSIHLKHHACHKWLDDTLKCSIN